MLPTIGKAIVGVLQHPKQTRMYAVCRARTSKTSKELAIIGNKTTRAEEWVKNIASTDELVEQAWAELGRQQTNLDIFVLNFIKASIWVKVLDVISEIWTTNC